MITTINQVHDRLRSLALSHHQVNSFYFGDKWEHGADTDIEYPAVLVSIQPSSFNRDLRTQQLNFKVYFLDTVGVAEDSEANETEVISDMNSVAGDFIALLNQPDLQEDFVEVSPSNSVVPFTEEENDLVAGVVLDLGISVLFTSDACQVPAEDIDPENNFDMARTKIKTFDGPTSDTFDVSGLAGRVVLAVYRAGRYLRAITTVPVDSDTIMIDGVDLGSNRGISASSDTVRLQSGDGLVEGELLDFLIWSN